jgi:hypothetical protein
VQGLGVGLGVSERLLAWHSSHGLSTCSQAAPGAAFRGRVGRPHRVSPGMASRCQVRTLPAPSCCVWPCTQTILLAIPTRIRVTRTEANSAHVQPSTVEATHQLRSGLARRPTAGGEQPPSSRPGGLDCRRRALHSSSAAARRASVLSMVSRFRSVRSSIPETCLLNSRTDSGRRSSLHSVTRDPDSIGSMRYPHVE